MFSPNDMSAFEIAVLEEFTVQIIVRVTQNVKGVPVMCIMAGIFNIFSQPSCFD